MEFLPINLANQSIACAGNARGIPPSHVFRILSHHETKLHLWSEMFYFSAGLSLLLGQPVWLSLVNRVARHSLWTRSAHCSVCRNRASLFHSTEGCLPAVCCCVSSLITFAKLGVHLTTAKTIPSSGSLDKRCRLFCDAGLPEKFEAQNTKRRKKNANDEKIPSQCRSPRNFFSHSLRLFVLATRTNCVMNDSHDELIPSISCTLPIIFWWISDNVSRARGPQIGAETFLQKRKVKLDARSDEVNAGSCKARPWNISEPSQPLHSGDLHSTRLAVWQTKSPNLSRRVR